MAVVDVSSSVVGLYNAGVSELKAPDSLGFTQVITSIQGLVGAVGEAIEGAPTLNLVAKNIGLTGSIESLSLDLISANKTFNNPLSTQQDRVDAILSIAADGSSVASGLVGLSAVIDPASAVELAPAIAAFSGVSLIANLAKAVYDIRNLPQYTPVFAAGSVYDQMGFDINSINVYGRDPNGNLDPAIERNGPQTRTQTLQDGSTLTVNVAQDGSATSILKSVSGDITTTNMDSSGSATSVLTTRADGSVSYVTYDPASGAISTNLQDNGLNQYQAGLDPTTSGDLIVPITVYGNTPTQPTTQEISQLSPTGESEGSIQVTNPGSGQSGSPTVTATLPSGASISLPATTAQIQGPNTGALGEPSAVISGTLGDITIGLQKQADGSTRLVLQTPTGTVALTDAQATAFNAVGSAGSYIGGQLAQLLVTNSALTNLATATVFSTAGQLISQEIDGHVLLNADLSVNYVVSDFVRNASSAIGGYAGGLAGRAIFTDLGIDPAIGQIIGGTIGAAVTISAVAEVSDDLGLGLQNLSTSVVTNLENGLPGAGVALFEAATGLSPDISVFGGSPENAEIGTSVGGVVGSVLGSIFPAVGTFAGGVIGEFLGGMIGGIFGETSVGPNAGAVLTLDPNAQQSHKIFDMHVGSDNSAPAEMIDTVAGLGYSMAALLNAELTVLAGGTDAVGTTLTAGAANVVQVRIFINSTTNQPDFYDALSLGTTDFPNITARDFGNGPTSYNDVLNDAVIRQLALMTISGGAPGMVTALDNSLLSFDGNYVSDALNGSFGTRESIGQLNYDLQAVADYNLYVQNKVAFLIGYAVRETNLNQEAAQEAAVSSTSYTPRDAAADWSAEMSRGALLQRVWAFTRGQGNLVINDDSTSNQANEGFLSFASSIHPSDVTLERNGNDLILAITGQAGDQVTITGAFGDAQHTLAQLKFSDTLSGTVYFGIELQAAFPKGSSGPIALTAIHFINDSASHAANYDGQSTVLHGASASLTLTGNNNTVVLTGAATTLNLTGNAAQIELDNQATLNLSGGQSSIVANATGDQLTVTNGGGNNINLNADGQDLAASGNGNIITVNGTGNAISVSGDTDIITSASDTITVMNGTTNLSAGGQGYSAILNSNISAALNGIAVAVIINGNSDTITSGVNGETATLNGSGDTATINGQNVTLTLAGSSTNSRVTVNAQYVQADVEGTSDYLQINGQDATVSLGGSNNTVNTAGNSITLRDGAVGAAIQGGGNSDIVGSGISGSISSFGGDTILISGSGNSLDISDTYANITISGSNNLIHSLDGSNNTISVGGIGNNIFALGSDDLISVAGQGQSLATDSATITVAAGSTLTLFESSTAYQVSNGNIINLGSGATLNVAGGNNWVNIGGADTISFSGYPYGAGNGVGGSGTGNNVTFKQDGYADLNHSTITFDGNEGAAGVITVNGQVTGSDNTIVATSGATLSITGTGNTIQASGSTLTFAAPVGAQGTPFAIRGFAFPSYAGNEFNDATSAASLATMKATGANAAEIVSSQYLYNPGLPDQDAYTINASVPQRTAADGSTLPARESVSDANLIGQIQQAQSQGLQVLLKPHIDPADGTWRALQTPQNIAAFFTNYQNFIVHYAQIAQETGVQTFSIGCELQSLTGQQYLPYWTQIIQAVRAVYSGQLTYASATYEIGTVSFWSQLDIIGTDAYERTSSQAVPTEAQLEAGWTQPVPVAANPITTEGATKSDGFYDASGTPISPIAKYESLSEQYNKPILITEAGYASVNETDLLEGDGSRTGTTYIDYQQQANAYQALLNALTTNNGSLPGQSGQWLDGAYLWSWAPDPSSVTADDLSVQGKPALSVVEAAYNTASASGTAITNTVNGASNNITVAVGQTLRINGNNNTITEASGTLSVVAGTGNTVNGANNSEANLVGSNNTATMSIGSYVGLISGTGLVLNESSGSTIMLSNVSATINGSSDTITLNPGDTLTLTGGANKISVAAGDTISSGASNAFTISADVVAVSGTDELILTGSGNTLSIGAASTGLIAFETDATNDLIMRFGNGDRVLIDGQLADNQHGVDNITFSNGVVWDRAVIASATNEFKLFDSTYYLAQNPDVKAAGVDPFLHYIANGWHEGRNPSALFDTNYYLTQNPDVKAANVDPLANFAGNGWVNGREPSLVFSDSKYLAAYPDVAAANVNPLLHYMVSGEAHGRMAFIAGGTATADPLINPTYYDQQLGATLIPPGTAGQQQAASSYNTIGWKEALNPDFLFDTNYYLTHNPDVAAAGVDPLTHYETFGWKEGRDPSTAFSTHKYLDAYPDIKAAGVNPLLQYITSGEAAGRAIFPV